MATDPSHRVRTAGVSSKRLVPNEAHLSAIQDAVQRTRFGPPLSPPTLLHLYVRNRLANREGTGLEGVFRSNLLLSVRTTRSHTGEQAARAVPSSRASRETWMPVRVARPADRQVVFER